jgi:CBS domain-containing protein
MPIRLGMGQQQTRRSGPGWMGLLGGVGLGSALVYLLDPAQRARRARVRGKAVRAAHAGARDVKRVERDLSNRARGLFARLRGVLRPPQEADDEIVRERVRSSIGHVCSHPRAIEVDVSDGTVLLWGPVLEREHDAVLRAVRRIAGVRAVDDDLESHLRANGVPGLQGNRHDPPPSGVATTRCEDIMKQRLQTVGPEDSIQQAAELMALANVGFLPVCDADRRILGTITDRDIVVRALAKGASPAGCRVGDVMTPEVIACSPDDPVTLAEQFMAQHQVSRIVVTDEDGILAGVISLSDVAERDAPRRVGRTLRAIAAREAPSASAPLA